jgi:hypothetical protein
MKTQAEIDEEIYFTSGSKSYPPEDVDDDQCSEPDEGESDERAVRNG